MIDQYNYFIKTQKETIQFYFDLLHTVYDKKNQLYKIISKHKDYLYFIGFPFNKLEEYNDDIHILGLNMAEYDFDESIEYMTLKANVTNYIYLCTKRIPLLEDKLNYHNFLVSIPYETFRELHLTLNHEISKKIIRGQLYEFPNGVGAIKVYRFNRNFKRPTVNWGESNKLKKTNPDKYIVYHIDDEFVAAKYLKSKARVQNYKYYRFKLTSFINTKDRSKQNVYNSVKSMDEILDNPKLGNLEKMLAVTHLETPKFYDKHDL